MKKYSKETVVGIFMVVGIVCIGYMTVKLGNLGILEDNTYSLFARFSNVAGLRAGNPVTMLGLEIGKVDGFSIDQESQVAVVEFKINKDIKVFDDAIASIKTEGLIGDKFVEIDVGGSGDELKPGDTITETEPPVDLQEMIRKYAFGSVEKE
jgi:phospholipid/cholesterol/gamma-HCH transport system substrate-binding protein